MFMVSDAFVCFLNSAYVYFIAFSLFFLSNFFQVPLYLYFLFYFLNVFLYSLVLSFFFLNSSYMYFIAFFCLSAYPFQVSLLEAFGKGLFFLFFLA